MHPLAYIIGVPLGFWMSDVIDNLPETIERINKRRAITLEARFGEGQRIVDNRKAYEAQRSENTRQTVSEYMKRNKR